MGGGSSRSRPPGLRRPPPPDKVAVPAQHGFRRNDHQQPGPSGPWNHLHQRREQRSISLGHPRPGHMLTLQDRELMAKQQDLRRLPRLLTLRQAQPPKQAGHEQEDEPQAHDRRSSQAVADQLPPLPADTGWHSRHPQVERPTDEADYRLFGCLASGYESHVELITSQPRRDAATSAFAETMQNDELARQLFDESARQS